MTLDEIKNIERDAELQFAAIQRAHSENAKRLRAQIAAYFAEPEGKSL